MQDIYWGIKFYKEKSKEQVEFIIKDLKLKSIPIALTKIINK